MIAFVPAIYYRAEAVVDRVWGWSPVEETILLSLRDRPATNSVLSSTLGIQQQVVEASVIRLMRFGLVEIRMDPEPAFAVSDAGREHIAAGRPLPDRIDRRIIRVGLVFERLGGSVFRRKLVSIHPVRTKRKAEIRIPFQTDDMQESDVTMSGRVRQLLHASLRTGEVFAGVRQVSSVIEDRYLEVDLNQASRGTFPEGATEDFRAAVASMITSKHAPSLPHPSSLQLQDRFRVLQTPFDGEQLVLGGPEHLRRFEMIIDSARSDVFILSTFVAPQDDPKAPGGQQKIWQAIERAIARGVHCHLFYGSSLDDDGRHARNMEDLRRRLRTASPNAGHVLVHNDPVDSHAKFVIADDGASGGQLLVGSCNWLQSPFRALEMSVDFRDESVVAEGLSLLRTITSTLPTARRSRDAMQGMENELRRLSRGLIVGPGASNAIPATATILQGPEHLPLLRRAAHDATDRFVCGTNKMGAPMVSNLLDPASVAGKRLQEVRILHSLPTGPVKKRHVRTEKDRMEGIAELHQIAKPMLHAKFLLWDDDDVVITSFNWGSQSGSVDKPLDEIGVHLHMPGLATQLLEKLDALDRS